MVLKDQIDVIISAFDLKNLMIVLAVMKPGEDLTGRKPELKDKIKKHLTKTVYSNVDLSMKTDDLIALDKIKEQPKQ